GRAAERCMSFCARRNGSRLPRLRLAFRDHQLLTSRSDGSKHSLAGHAGRASAGAIEVERSMTDTAQAGPRVVIDANDVGQRSGNRERIALVAGAPPLRESNDKRGGQEA